MPLLGQLQRPPSQSSLLFHQPLQTLQDLPSIQQAAVPLEGSTAVEPIPQENLILGTVFQTLMTSPPPGLASHGPSTQSLLRAKEPQFLRVFSLGKVPASFSAQVCCQSRITYWHFWLLWNARLSGPLFYCVTKKSSLNSTGRQGVPLPCFRPCVPGNGA